MPGTVQWKVIPPVMARTQIDATGQPVQGKVVTFQLSTGQTGTVFVPDAQFSTDGVKAAIQPVADNLDAVLNLTSGG